MSLSKNIIIILLLFSSTIPLFAEEKTYLVTNNLKGEVRYIETYNSDARLYFEEVLEENTQLTQKTIIDENGRLIEQIYFVDGIPNQYQKSWYRDDILLKTLKRNNDGITYYEYEYNENNEMTVSRIRDENQELLKYSEHTYKIDDDTRVTWIYNYSPQKEIIGATKYRFDLKENLLEEVSFDNSGEKTSVSKYEYDEDGNFQHQLSYNAEGVVGSSFSEENNVEKFNFYDDSGEIITSYITIKNDRGFIVGFKVEYFGEMSILDNYEYRYEYEIDKYGNWIKKTEYEALEKYGEIVFEPIEIETRKIIYRGDNTEFTISTDEYEQIKKIHPENEITTNFYVFEKVDPLDDINTIYFMLDAAEGVNQYGDRISLVIRAKPQQTEIYIRWETYLGDDALVTFRIDDEEPLSKTWSNSTNNEASFYPDDELEFIQQLLNAKSLIVRTTPYGENPITAIFDVSGFKIESEPYLEYLNWSF